MTALHVACRRTSLKVAQLLVEQGVDLEVRYIFLGEKSTALMDAVSDGHTDLVQILLESHTNPCTTNRYGETPLDIAMCQGSTAMIKLLIHFGAEVTKIDLTSAKFSESVYAGNTGIVETLCEITGVDEATEKRWLARAEVMRVIRDS